MGRHSKPRARRGTLAASLLALMAGSMLLGYAVRDYTGDFNAAAMPKQPQVSETERPLVRTPSRAPKNSDGSLQAQRHLQVPASPSLLTIDSMQLQESEVVPLTLADDGALEVPEDPWQVGYWRSDRQGGPLRPTIFVGHLDSTSGPAIFYRLSVLVSGDLIKVEDAQGRTWTYEVVETEQTMRDAFPTRRVYGPTKRPELRLLTCSGDYVESSYLQNLIVYAVARRTPNVSGY